MLNTSVLLLAPTGVHNEYGSWIGNFLIVDARVKIFSPQHLPYAILSISILTGLIFIPTLLQLLYPMLWFQKLLNRLHLNSPGLRLCMESFQGYYRDRSDGGWECRYFSVVYPSTRILVYALNMTIHDLRFLLACMIFCIDVAAIILILRPYKVKYRLYNTLDALMMLNLAVLMAFILELVLYSDMKHLSGDLVGLMGGALALTPLLYFTVRTINYIYKQTHTFSA